MFFRHHASMGNLHLLHGKYRLRILLAERLHQLKLIYQPFGNICRQKLGINKYPRNPVFFAKRRAYYIVKFLFKFFDVLRFNGKPSSMAMSAKTDKKVFTSS